MQYLLGLFAFLLALLLSFVDPVIAQSGAVTSRTTLRQQDRQECTKQVMQQNVDKRNQAAFVLKCEADRQASRNAVQKSLREKQAAKQADCKKQAREQNLHLTKRWRFIKKCAAE